MIDKKIIDRSRHDECFRTSLAIPEVAKEFLASNLPKDLLQDADLETIEHHKTDFINEQLKESVCDVLMKLKIKGEDSYFYTLVEAQSSNDEYMGIRILEYMAAITKHHRVANPDDKKIPFIYPLIFANSEDNDTMEPSPWGSFTNPTLAKRYFMGPYKYVNVNNIKDSELQQKMYYGALALSMKYKKKLPYQEILKILGGLLNDLYRQNDSAKLLILTIMCYIIDNRSKITAEQLKTDLRSVLHDKGDEVMNNLFQEWVDQGLEQGVQQGLEQGLEQGIMLTAKNMLAEGSDIEFISKCTGLSITQIKALQSD